MGYFYFYLPNSIFNASLKGKSRQKKQGKERISREGGRFKDGQKSHFPAGWPHLLIPLFQLLTSRNKNNHDKDKDKDKGKTPIFQQIGCTKL